jgi:hypothetical protein
MARRHPDVWDPASYPLQIQRLEKTDEVFVRLLTEIHGRILGFNVHYVSDESVYCGPKCTRDHAKLKSQWKGYLAAERYHQPTNLWYPCVLEITEGCELLMRGRAARGQVWRLWRHDEGKGKKTGVQAELIDQLDPYVLQRPFDLLVTIRRTYHDLSIELSTPNPMPPKVIVQATEGAPPKGLEPQSAPGPVPTFAELDPVLARSKQAQAGQRTRAHKNGASTSE